MIINWLYMIKNMKEQRSNKNQLVFEYVNWKGEKGIRRVIPIKLWWGSTQWHPEPQWLLKAKDLDKNEERDFAVKDITRFNSVD